MRALGWRGGTGESTVITQQRSDSQASRGEWRTCGGTDQGHRGSGLLRHCVYLCQKPVAWKPGKEVIFSPLKPYECILQWGVYKKKKKKQEIRNYQHPEPILLSSAPHKAESVLRAFKRKCTMNESMSLSFTIHDLNKPKVFFIFFWRTIGYEKGKPETGKKSYRFPIKKRPGPLNLGY